MSDIDVDRVIGFLERSDENYKNLSEDDKVYIARQIMKRFDELLFENDRFKNIVNQLESLREDVEHITYRTRREE